MTLARGAAGLGLPACGPRGPSPSPAPAPRTLARPAEGEDDGVAVSFLMTDTGRPEEGAPIVPVGHKCGESARRIRLTCHGLPADRAWYLVLVQAYLEQGRAKGDRVWCPGLVLTKG